MGHLFTEKWAADAAAMLHLLLGRPASHFERWLLITLALIVLFAALLNVSKSMSVPELGRYRSLAVGVVGVVGMLAGMVLARDWLLPLAGIPAHTGVLIACGVAASLMLVVLTMGWLQRATFAMASVTWLTSLIMVAALVLAIGGLFSLLSRGSKEVAQTKSRTAAMDRFLKNP